MPEPKENESEKDFVERCIPMVLDEGTAEDGAQAAAMCHSMYRKANGEKSLDGDDMLNLGDEVKAISQDGDLLRVGAYGIRFGSPSETDLVGDWFSPQTDYGPTKGDGAPTMVHHGVPLRPELADLADMTFAPATVKQDEIGLFVESVLDLSDRYQAANARLVQAGKMRWSSGTAAHIVRRDAETGLLKRWWPVEWSYTPSAAEPRLPPIAPIKALESLTFPGLEVEPPEVGEKPTATTTEGNVTVNIYVSSDQITTKEAWPLQGQEEVKMDENEKTTPQVDVDAIVKGAVESALKAYQDKIEAEPPVKTAAYVTKDRADRALEGNPFKSFGDMLLSVARAGSHGINDERLLPLKSSDPLDENGFSVAKAMGPAFVGSLYGRKASGMSEGNAASAGFLVSADKPGGILNRVYDIGSVLQRVSMMQLSANANSLTLHAEDESSRAAGYRRGGIRAYWAAEAGTVTASYPAFRDVELKLKKLMALVYATDELLSDATALESYIMGNLPEELRFVAEDAILNGTGAGQPLGLVNSGAIVSVAKETGQTADTVVAQNIIKMWARLWTPSKRNAVWLISPDVEPQLMQMSLATGTGGQLVYMPPGGLSASPYGSIFGRPVLPVEYCNKVGDTGDIYLVDLNQYQMIEKGGLESASSIHVKFLYDESVFRFIYRCDGQPLWDQDLDPANGGDAVSPYVKLDAR